MQYDDINMLNETLQITESGSYLLYGEQIHLKHTAEERRKAIVLLPDEVEKVCQSKVSLPASNTEGCQYTCENVDSFTLARRRDQDRRDRTKPVLVLNLASPVHPGGGVRRGTHAQEEDLCRKSSLLLSLESEAAQPYYDYHRSLSTFMGSNAVILSPTVEIIRDENGNLLSEPVTVSVLTCAAPKLTKRLDDEEQQQYCELFYNRIISMLKCAAYFGYRDLVLGAWGCGAYGNDAAVVSYLFDRAFRKIHYCGRREKELFDHIDFAILCRYDDYNIREFARYFDHFIRKEEMQKPLSVLRDRIRGCLIGGASGDALGYAVEFLREKQIFAKFGAEGIQSYRPDAVTGKAPISDDTQMTLFTANAVLIHKTRVLLKEDGPSLHAVMAQCYVEWYKTQNMAFSDLQKKKEKEHYITWLIDVPGLFQRQAPGITCLNALDNVMHGEPVYNNSKGCGGVMRAAPMGLISAKAPLSQIAEAGADLTYITHQHPLGYMPSAMLVDLIHRIVFDRRQQDTLELLVLRSRDAMAELYHGKPFVDVFLAIIDQAIALSHHDAPDLENIHKLGEGWVGEEALAIALYCALRHADDFSAGIIAAVNHNGDSDSTGAVAGNILGAWLGFSAIEDRWKQELELYEVILEMADDLVQCCCVEETSMEPDAAWIRKYCHATWKETARPVIVFWHEYDEYGEFSNWYAARFVVDGITYANTEQYMMSEKAKLFHDEACYAAILQESDPAKCKKLGKQVKPFDAQKWGSVSFEIVKKGNREKFLQNPALLQLLLSTGDSLLAEASPYDTLWGIGLDPKAAGEVPSSQWLGKNRLGRVLMELREEFRAR